MDDKLDEIKNWLKKIKSEIGQLSLLVLLVFISTCNTCNNVEDLKKEQKKTNVYLEQIAKQLKDTTLNGEHQ